jgi:hypothetical protein
MIDFNINMSKTDNAGYDMTEHVACFVDPQMASPAHRTSTPQVPSSPPSQRQFPGRPQPLRGNTGRSKFHIPSREGR